MSRFGPKQPQSTCSSTHKHSFSHGDIHALLPLFSCITPLPTFSALLTPSTTRVSCHLLSPDTEAHGCQRPSTRGLVHETPLIPRELPPPSKLMCYIAPHSLFTPGKPVAYDDEGLPTSPNMNVCFSEGRAKLPSIHDGVWTTTQPLSTNGKAKEYKKKKYKSSTQPGCSITREGNKGKRD